MKSYLAVSGFADLVGEEGILEAVAAHEPRPLYRQPQCEIGHFVFTVGEPERSKK